VTRLRMPRRVSQRDSRNLCAFYGGATEMETKPAVKRGPQKESLVGKANREWASAKGGRLYKNRRGLLDLPNGGKLPIGLGPNGFPDECGYLPVLITPEFIGRTIAVAFFIEDKTEDGVVAPHQLAIIEELRDHGCIAGVSRGVEDTEAIYNNWRNQHGK
jgi:hypothetical protein